MCGVSDTKASSILFQENFEGVTITSFHQFGEGKDTLAVQAWPVGCGRAGVGTAAVFASKDVNFHPDQNATRFVGVNPQDPCKGFYSVRLTSDSLDFSTGKSVVFQCNYMVTSTLKWNFPASIPCIVLQFKNGSKVFKDSMHFSARDNWQAASIEIPDTMLGPKVLLSFELTCGEGIGIDDIIISSKSTDITHRSSPARSNSGIFLASGEQSLRFGGLKEAIGELMIFDIRGRTVVSKVVSGNGNFAWKRRYLLSGVYTAMLKVADRQARTTFMVR